MTFVGKRMSYFKETHVLTMRINKDGRVVTNSHEIWKRKPSAFKRDEESEFVSYREKIETAQRVTGKWVVLFGGKIWADQYYHISFITLILH